MPQIGLDRSGIDVVVGQLEAASMREHVRVDLDIEACSLASALDHRLKATLGEWRAAFRCEYERKSAPCYGTQNPREGTPNFYGSFGLIPATLLKAILAELRASGDFDRIVATN
jgi:hypothetical protein